MVYKKIDELAATRTHNFTPSTEEFLMQHKL